MTNPCTCKAEHWQPHADTCPAKVERPLLTIQNIRSGAVPSDAHAVGFLLGEIERLRELLKGANTHLLSVGIFDPVSRAVRAEIEVTTDEPGACVNCAVLDALIIELCDLIGAEHIPDRIYRRVEKRPRPPEKSGVLPVLDENPVGKCNACGRKTWNTHDIGKIDSMTQPSGRQCLGTFVAL